MTVCDFNDLMTCVYFKVAATATATDRKKSEIQQKEYSVSVEKEKRFPSLSLLWRTNDLHVKNYTNYQIFIS